MAGAKGYHSYRGRASRGKIVLAVILIAVIAAALMVIRMQRYIVYDEDGRPRLELPWQNEAEETPEGDSLDEVDLTIQEPEKPAALYVFTVPETPLTRAGWQDAWMNAMASSALPYNAVAVTVKDSAGTVYFPSQTAVSGAVKPAEDTAEALGEMIGDSGVYTVARMSCFRDPRAAMADVEGMGLKNTGGFIFYDGNNTQWLDPAKPAARAYLCGLLKELAELGFDEILLTDVSYPTKGKLKKIDYGEIDYGEIQKSKNFTIFLQEICATLEPYGTALSIELPEAVIAGGSDDFAGLDLSNLAPLTDRVYAVTAPERAAALEAAVTAAAGKTAFVAELRQPGKELPSGGCLILG